MNKLDIINTIFCDSQKGKILKKRINYLSKAYLLRCLSFYEKAKEKEKAKDFLFGILNR